MPRSRSPHGGAPSTGRDVYQLVDESGDAGYYGITKNPARRIAQHAKTLEGPFNGMQVVSKLLAPPQARRSRPR